MACPVKMLLLFVLNVFLSMVGNVSANKTNPYYMEVSPHQDFPQHLDEGEERELTFTLRSYSGEVYKIMPVVVDSDIAEIRTNMSQTMDSNLYNITTKIKGVFLGRTSVKLFTNTTQINSPEKYNMAPVSVKDVDESDWYEQPAEFPITVSRVESALSHSFTGMIIVLVCLANVAMGCKTELSVVKEVLKKPIGPVTGMFSQFVLMPLIALGVIYALNFDGANALGFFAMACSPGGSASNAYSYLLAGDVSLSVTMTLCSTLLSLGMIPLWLFTVGAKVLYNTEVSIPFMNIFTSLAGLLIPVAIGMLIQWKLPRIAKYIVKGIRPLMVIFFIFVFTVGVYANLYIFKLMRDKPEILLAGALVPYLGFIFGGVVAFFTKQSWKRIRTIAIETGIQNTGIAIVLLKVSLPAPDNDISIVPPISAAIFTPIPMLVAIISYEVYKRCFKKKKEESYIDDHEGDTDTDSSFDKGNGDPDQKYMELKNKEMKNGNEVNHNKV